MDAAVGLAWRYSQSLEQSLPALPHEPRNLSYNTLFIQTFIIRRACKATQREGLIASGTPEKTGFE